MPHPVITTYGTRMLYSCCFVCRRLMRVSYYQIMILIIRSRVKDKFKGLFLSFKFFIQSKLKYFDLALS